MNPYQVLGVPEGASPEAIRAAYRELVKKYHPDRYQDNPLKELAEEKLKEINEAYDILSKQMEAPRARTYGQGRGPHTGENGGASQSQSRTSYTGAYADQYARAREALARHDLDAALRILEAVPVREAEWFFLMGHIYFQQKMFDAARKAYAQAVSMDPNNFEYRRAYQSASGASAYTDRDVVVCGNGSGSYGGRGWLSACCLGSICLSCLSPCCSCGNSRYGYC